MPKHQNENISSRESQVCHLTHASQTARFWQLGWPVLGGNFWFPGWNIFILVFWHSYKAYLNVFTWISCQTFFFTLCKYPSNPQWVVCQCHKSSIIYYTRRGSFFVRYLPTIFTWQDIYYAILHWLNFCIDEKYDSNTATQYP